MVLFKKGAILFLWCLGTSLSLAQQDVEPIEHIKFEGSLIEGQMGTIKALIVTSEKRPEFEPMALQLGNKNIDINNMNKKIIEENQYREAFEVQLPK